MSKKQRYSGILMHISSLRGADSVGTLGLESYHFVDFLRDHGVKVWQLLPLGRTDNSHSPYQCYSTFAGNEYYIDLGYLHAKGWLSEAPDHSEAPEGNVEWTKVKKEKSSFLWDAFYSFRYQNQFDSADYLRFWEENRSWLEDYSLFMALLDRYDGVSWNLWPKDLRNRLPEALAQAYYESEETVLFHRFVQFVFFTEWNLLHHYAAQQGVQLMGDLPLYVAYNSVDVWVHPEQFQLDEELNMSLVGGVPPDDFNDQGQHWGNPLFDWEQMEEDQYKWWMDRLHFQFRLYDRLRIDHFRGLESYYAIEASRKDGKVGEWLPAKGKEMLSLLSKDLYPRIVAEDLGLIDEKVRDLRDAFNLDGMGVFQFAFDENRENVHLPMHYDACCCAYIGTHDNPTFNEWLGSLEEQEKQDLVDYIGCEEVTYEAVVRLLMLSHASGVVLQFQDILGLGKEGRMNKPGTIEDNWNWRSPITTYPVYDWLKKYNDIFNR